MFKKLLFLITVVTTITVGQTLKRHYDVTNAAYYHTTGAHVDTLYDLSGQNKHAWQTDTTRAGVIFSSKIGGQPALWFDDSNYYECLKTDSMDVTIFIVTRFSQGADGQDYLLGNGLLEPPTVTLGLDAVSPSGWKIGGSYFQGDRSKIELQNRVVALWNSADYDSAKLWESGYLNNTVVTSGSPKTCFNLIGGYFKGTSAAMRNYSGWVSEIRVYTGVNATTRQTILDSLSDKYSIRVSSDLPDDYPNVDDVEFWIDANDATIQTITPVTNVVDSLYNKGGFPTLLLAPGTGNPTRVDDPVTAKKMWYFNGEHGFYSPSPNEGTYVLHPFTMIAVFDPDTTVDADIMTPIDFGSSPSYRSAMFKGYPTATAAGGLSFAGSTIYGDSIMSQQRQIYMVRFGTGGTINIQVQYQGGLKHTIKDTAVTINTYTAGGIGVGNAPGIAEDNEFVGNIMEIVAWNVRLPDDSVTLAFATLYNKWFGGGVELTYPCATPNEVFDADSVITVTWTATTDSVFSLQYSLDNGGNWNDIFFEQLFAYPLESPFSYDWTIPNEYSEQALLRIRLPEQAPQVDDEGDNSFAIIPHSLVNIISPIDTTVALTLASDPINVIIETVQVDSLTLYWGSDTTNLNLLETITIDTVNVSYADTTIYEWQLLPTLNGNNIYLYAVAGVDTILYTFTSGYNFLGTRLPTYIFCTSETDAGLFASKWLTDPSCGWVGTITWDQWLKYLSADGSGYTYTKTYNTYPDRAEPYPSLGNVNIVVAPDTIPFGLNLFYETYGGSGTTDITYKLRRYYIENDTMKMDDLRNGITGICLFEMYEDVDHPDAAWDMWQIYNVRWDSVVNNTYDNSFDFESLNPTNFTPLILVGNSDTPWNVISFEALDAPIDPDAADDMKRVLLYVSSQRNYFRGVHPKAEKRN